MVIVSLKWQISWRIATDDIMRRRSLLRVAKLRQRANMASAFAVGPRRAYALIVHLPALRE